MSLAHELEADIMIRNVGREHGSLMRWVDKKTIGIVSMKTCSLNNRLLHLTALWWVQMSEKPASIPIDRLRNEVWGCLKNLVFTQVLFHKLVNKFLQDPLFFWTGGFMEKVDGFGRLPSQVTFGDLGPQAMFLALLATLVGWNGFSSGYLPIEC